MTYAASRKQILLTLQSRISYLKSGKALTGGEEYWIGHWDLILAALRAALLYYKAEVVRCKHETLAYMKGLDAEETYGEHEEVKALMQVGGGFRAALNRARYLQQQYWAEKDNPIEAAFRQKTWEDAEKLVKSYVEKIETLTKDVEGITYVGQ